MEIGDFFTIYQASVWAKDVKAIIRLYDVQAVIFDMWDKGFIINSSEWNKSIEDWLGSLGEEKVKVEFEMINIHQSLDAAFASALISYQAISKEGLVLRSMKNRISLGFSKFEEGWKVVHQHTSAPIDSNRLSAIFDI
jgi:ketosteroid isomerase-like protein